MYFSSPLEALAETLGRAQVAEARAHLAKEKKRFDENEIATGYYEAYCQETIEGSTLNSSAKRAAKDLFIDACIRNPCHYKNPFERQKFDWVAANDDQIKDHLEGMKECFRSQLEARMAQGKRVYNDDIEEVKKIADVMTSRVEGFHMDQEMPNDVQYVLDDDYRTVVDWNKYQKAKERGMIKYTAAWCGVTTVLLGGVMLDTGISPQDFFDAMARPSDVIQNAQESADDITVSPETVTTEAGVRMELKAPGDSLPAPVFTPNS